MTFRPTCRVVDVAFVLILLSALNSYHKTSRKEEKEIRRDTISWGVAFRAQCMKDTRIVVAFRDISHELLLA